MLSSRLMAQQMSCMSNCTIRWEHVSKQVNGQLKRSMLFFLVLRACFYPYEVIYPEYGDGSFCSKLQGRKAGKISCKALQRALLSRVANGSIVEAQQIGKRQY